MPLSYVMSEPEVILAQRLIFLWIYVICTLQFHVFVHLVKISKWSVCSNFVVCNTRKTVSGLHNIIVYCSKKAAQHVHLFLQYVCFVCSFVLFDLFVCRYSFMFPWAVESSPLQFFFTEWEMYITAQGCRLRNDLNCVEWDVKLYYTIPYTFFQVNRD